MVKTYRFAGVEIAVDIPSERMYEQERHLAPFRSSSVENPHCFHFSVVDCLSPPEGELLTAQSGFWEYGAGELSVRYIGAVQGGWEHGYIRAWHSGREHRVQLLGQQFPGRIGVKTVLTALAAEHLVLQAQGIVFHSACIQYGAGGILFTAPSGTGKSTQADLWYTLRGAAIRNGDRSVIRLTPEGIFACGLPFAGSSQYCDHFTLPLLAVVYLQQAPQTTIRRLSGYEAFSRLWEGCSVNIWKRQDMADASALVSQIAARVPVYQLACTPDESAVVALESVLPPL